MSHSRALTLLIFLKATRYLLNCSTSPILLQKPGRALLLSAQDATKPSAASQLPPRRARPNRAEIRSDGTRLPPGKYLSEIAPVGIDITGHDSLLNRTSSASDCQIRSIHSTTTTTELPYRSDLASRFDIQRYRGNISHSRAVHHLWCNFHHFSICHFAITLSINLREEQNTRFLRKQSAHRAQQHESLPASGGRRRGSHLLRQPVCR